MNSIQIIDGKVCLVKEVSANPSLPTIKRELLFSVEQLLCALKKRMDHCISPLQEAIEANLVIQVTECQVFYVDKNQSVRAFNIPSFEAMKEAIKILQDHDEHKVACIPCETMLVDFNRAQLNQIKKAITSHFGHWSDSASALEELEMYKMQEREY